MRSPSGADARRARSPRRIAVVGLLLAVLAGLAPAPGVLAASIADTLVSLEVGPRVLTPDGDGQGDELSVRIVLARPATVAATVVDYAGGVVEPLLPSGPREAGEVALAWNGRRSANGALVPNAGYRLRIDLVNELGIYRVEEPFVKASGPIYPANPAAIVVALDPGHGGRDPGASAAGVVEKHITLDVARRLRAMLEGAGVSVVMTRSGDTRVNAQARDLDGDRRIGYRDELASRIEVANGAAADLLLSIHVNASDGRSARGVETWYTRDRTFGSANRQLATAVQTALVSGLGAHRSRAWKPLDRGTRRIQFYLTGAYERRTLPRPSLMPGVLSEMLFVTNPGDRAVLRSPARRQRVAEAYYDAIGAYINARAQGARYALVGLPPASMAEGSAGSMQVEVTNTGRTTWAAESAILIASWLPRVPFYDGSGAPGTTMGSVRLPELAPGASAVVDLAFVAPPYAPLASRSGRALLKLDLVAGGPRLSRAGVVPLQVPLTVTAAPAPGPTPSPNPTPVPTVDPGAPSPPAEPTPTTEPSLPPAEPTPTIVP